MTTANINNGKAAILPISENGSGSGSGMDMNTKPERTPRNSLWKHLKTDISLEYADLPIIATCVVSGLCDSSAYNAWSCFVSMQTGRL